VPETIPHRLLHGNPFICLSIISELEKEEPMMGAVVHRVIELPFARFFYVKTLALRSI
jgi:hypothetical protein